MKGLLLLARLIVILWAGFWILFVVGSALGEGGRVDVPAGESLKGFLTAAAIVIVCAGAVFLAWRPPLVAGILLILIGIGISAAFSRIARPGHVLLILGLPPFLAGVLFLIGAIRRQRA